MLFAQGEAFNRTKYKLPDADTVLKGAGGYTVGDSLASLIGFETDHATQVDAAQNARSQALEALNDYAQQSGENLLSTETLSAPQTLTMTDPSGQKSVTDLAGSVIDVTPDGSVKPASASVQSHYVEPPVVQPVVNQQVDPPTPAYGIAVQAPARQTGAGSGSGGYTTPSSAPRTPRRYTNASAANRWKVWDRCWWPSRRSAAGRASSPKLMPDFLNWLTLPRSRRSMIRAIPALMMFPPGSGMRPPSRISPLFMSRRTPCPPQAKRVISSGPTWVRARSWKHSRT